MGEGEETPPSNGQPMNTYNFYDMAGQLLDTVATDDPQQAASEISHFNGVDADEVVYEPCQPETPHTKPCSHPYGRFVTFDGCLYQIRGNGNKPQLYLISSEQAEIEKTQLDASIYTQ